MKATAKFFKVLYNLKKIQSYYIFMDQPKSSKVSFCMNLYLYRKPRIDRNIYI